MKNLSFEKQLIARQYNDKWTFSNCNQIVKKLQCNHVLSFSNNDFLADVYNDDVPISTCKFSHKFKDILAVANENGIVRIENVKLVKNLKTVQTHKNTVYDIAWMPESSQFVTVSGDNSAKLWDCTESSVNLISTFIGHKRSVRCVSFKPQNTAVFATGSRDGSLMIWDTRAWKKCAKFSHHLPDQFISSGAGSCSTSKKNVSVKLINASVTGLIFQNDNTLISCGSLDRFIRVWDMRKTYSRSTSNAVAKYQLASPNSGFSYLSMNTMGTKLYANCMDSYIYCYNINSYDPDPVAAFYGHENGSFYVKSSVSFDDSYLLSGSSDESAYLWDIKNAELSEEAVKPMVLLSAHTGEVTCVEMSSNNMVVVSCSDDGTFRLWNPFALKNDEREKVDLASSYDVEKVLTVKMQWKNKRKFKEIEEPENVTSDSTPHSKICRFYTVNLSSGCICHSKFTHGKGEKRLLDEDKNEKEYSKKLAVLKMLERTPPKQVLHSKPLPFLVNTSPIRRSIISLKVSSKRKLEDMPNFIEEGRKTKKINCGRVLAPSNSLESNENIKNDLTGIGVIKECEKSKLESFVKEYRSPKSDLKVEAIKSALTGLTSPTSNLPNYVEDGTSPYIHKCPRMIQKENDWLTKLRKTYKLKPNKMLEGKETSLKTSTLSSAEKRKQNKCTDHTLHKYFKLSSKTSEKSFGSQENQKKSCFNKN